MPKVFRPSHRETRILSKIETSKERSRKKAIGDLREHIDPLSNSIAMKLIENKLIETSNKNGIEQEIKTYLENLIHAQDFDIDYKIAPFRNLSHQPHIVTLYLTAHVIENLINHKDIVDIYGSDEDIYFCIHREVNKVIPL
ncbi:MAG: hypothetical protein HQK77_04910 [Desulfobacterales bacterium]|nr:hypothetical protein [Desulfobacterales bacterium]